MKHFLANEWHRDRAKKRGGGVQLIEWDALTLGFGGIANIPRPAIGALRLGLGGYYYVVLLAVLLSLRAR